MKVGELLKIKRKERNYSLRKLAIKIGISHSTIADVERGVINKKETIEKIISGLELENKEKEEVFSLLTQNIFPEDMKRELSKSNITMFRTLIKRLKLNGVTEKLLLHSLSVLEKLIDIDPLDTDKLEPLSHKNNKIDYSFEELYIENYGNESDLTVKLPVFGYPEDLSKGINLNYPIDEKYILREGISGDSFIVNVKCDSMSPEINPGDWVVAKPPGSFKTINQPSIITYGGFTSLAVVVQVTEDIIMLKYFNSTRYPEKFITKKDFDKLKIEGDIIKIVREKTYENLNFFLKNM